MNGQTKSRWRFRSAVKADSVFQLLLFAFFALTSPTAAHVLAKCAIHAGIAPKVGPDAGAKGGGPGAGGTPAGEGEPSKR